MCIQFTSCVNGVISETMCFLAKLTDQKNFKHLKQLYLNYFWFWWLGFWNDEFLGKKIYTYEVAVGVILCFCLFLFEMLYSLIQTLCPLLINILKSRVRREVMVLVLVLKSIAWIFFSFLRKGIRHISIAQL